MAPKSKKQFAEIRHEKRELILETALEIFATYGYHGASISMIAQHAGIAKGLLYNYFESKEELLKSILNEGIEELTKIYKPLLEDNFSDEMLTPELFRKLFKKFFQALKENTPFWRLFYALAMQPNVMEMIVHDYESLLNPYLELLAKYYKRQGSKNPRADALHAHALLDGITMNYVQPHDEFSIDEMEKVLMKRLEKPIY